LAATFPGPLIFIDTDGGLKTLSSRWFENWSGITPASISYETFDDEYDPKTGLFRKATAVWDIQSFVNDAMDNGPPATWVLDSVTSFQALAMHVGLELSGQVAGKGSRSQTLARARADAGHPVPLLTQADFGAEMSVFEQVMDQFTSLPCNIVCIAHEREASNEKGVVLRREPYIIGSSLRGKIAKWFDEVWYLDTDKSGTRILRTQPHGLVKVCKTRLGVPDGLEDPTYPKIQEALDALE
jgi:hypothetical protein